MDGHTGDSSLLVYSSSFHHSEEGQRAAALESALLINKEAACQPVCLLVFPSVSLATHLRSYVSTYLAVKMLHALLDVRLSDTSFMQSLSLFLYLNCDKLLLVCPHTFSNSQRLPKWLI